MVCGGIEETTGGWILQDVTVRVTDRSDDGLFSQAGADPGRTAGSRWDV